VTALQSQPREVYPGAVLGGKIDSRLGIAVAACVGALSLLSAPSAGAATTIGQLSPAPVSACNAGLEWTQPAVTGGTPYVVPAGIPSPTITSWSTTSGSAGTEQMTFKVYRKIADPAKYQVVAHDGPRQLAAGNALRTFPVNIPVNPGDVIGFHTNDAPLCAFSSPADVYLFLAGTGGLADGASGDFNSTSAFRLNVSAVVKPSNVFTVGGATKNKRKGTATLTVNVPGPGEISISGKGVKAASAAGASAAATVTAPGAVTLLVKATGKKRKKLNRSGKVKVAPSLSYTPTGGDPSTQSTTLKLKKLRK
jgi:hypothetical protein